MKIAVNKTTKQVVDILPDNATKSNRFVVNNGYMFLEVEDAYEEDGETFRQLTSVELAPILSERINVEYELAVSVLVAGVPSSEISTWTKQETEARLWQNDNTSSTPLLDAISTARGITKAYLVGKIIEKADLYAVAIGQLTGIRQKLEDEL